MVVQHNLSAMNANRMLGITQGTLSSSTEKLSSGYKINRAADDAAGLSISEKMRKQIRGLTQASANAEDGISSVQTAEGALTEVHDMLQRMNELATKAANGTNSESDRQSIQDEIEQLTTEIDRVAQTTKFNETYLLKGGKQTVTKRLNAYDAGLEGTMTDDGGKTATFTATLNVGESVDIAGKTYNIIEDTTGKGTNYKAKDDMTKIQDQIKAMAEDETVTINGTAYTASKADDGTIQFKSGTETLYSVEDITGKIEDGVTVSITGYNSDDSVVARDYTDTDNNKTAAQAAKLIQTALTQANNIGATKTAAKVDDGKLNTVAKGDLVTGIKNAETITASTDMVAEISDGTTTTYQIITANQDITDLVKSGTATFYKQVAIGGDTYAIANATTHNKDLLIAHTADTTTAGVEGVIAAGDTLAGGTGITSAASNSLSVAANYAAYEKVDDVDDFSVKEVTTTGTSHEAYAELDATNINVAATASVNFVAISSTNSSSAETIAKGQNLLIDDLNAGKITVTAKDATAGNSLFSHAAPTDSKLDVRENGDVYYDGIQVATLAVAGTVAKGDSGVLQVTGGSSKYAEVEYSESETKYSFTITKGETEVKQELGLSIHVGSDSDLTNKISVNIASMDSKGLGIAGLNVADDSGIAATYAIDAIENAIKTVSAQRSALGAVQNRLDHTINNLDNVVENTTSAESAIRDTDMATEMVKYSNANILSQAGQSMLAQANQSNQGVLSLLG